MDKDPSPSLSPEKLGSPSGKIEFPMAYNPLWPDPYGSHNISYNPSPTL